MGRYYEQSELEWSIGGGWLDQQLTPTNNPQVGTGVAIS